MAMTLIDRKRKLFEDIVRLRHAEREAPGNRDLVIVRAGLEDELGRTVSRRFAARMLGVSHTALERWIKAGDLAVVHTESGRQEIPLAALIELYAAVARERASGQRRRHVLEPTMVQRRERARLMRSDRLRPSRDKSQDPHERAARRALAYHRAVADQLHRSTVDDALHLVWQWRTQGQLDEGVAERWEEILGRSLPEIRQAIREDSEFARDLRQNSPFAGVLSEPERRRILEEID